MILYHGSNTRIVQIDLTRCRPYKDFGKGFYLTPIKEQAQKMAIRVSKIYGGNPTVTTFDYIPKDNLSIKIFDMPNEEWARFVINNRNKHFSDLKSNLCNHDCKYDIVVGPVADDDLAILFRVFSEGNITVEMLVERMKYKKLTEQYSFHTKVAVSCLSNIGAKQ